MAKELPYFKFEPNQWENGSIQLCSHEEQGVFINVCSVYWQRLGDLPYKLAVQKICGGNATPLDSLHKEGIIKIIDGSICIDFLNEQLAEFENTSSKNSENARLGWEKRRNKATPMPPHSDPNAIRGEEIKGNESKGDEFGAGKPATPTIDERQKIFMEKIAEHLNEYPKEMLRAFYDYWTEKNEGGRKMRFETQKIFEIGKRLKTWKRNESKNGTSNNRGKSITPEGTLDRLNGYRNRS